MIPPRSSRPTPLPEPQLPITLTGITAGAGDNNGQTLTVTAAVTSSNPALIPNPTVTYAPLTAITVNAGGGGSGYLDAEHRRRSTINGGNGTRSTRSPP